MPAPSWRAQEVEFTLWTSMKAGFGFAAGAALFGLFLFLIGVAATALALRL